MSGKDTTKQQGALLNNSEALHEILVAALTLSMQIEAPEAAEHILDALRALHGDDDDAYGGGFGAGAH